MMKPQFLEHIKSAFSSNTLLKCTLSKPGSQAPLEIKNVFIRPVALKKGLHLAFNYRYKTRDEVKNYTLEEAVSLLEQWLGNTFLNANLFTSESDYTLFFDAKGVPKFQQKPASRNETPDLTHDRAKQRLLDPSSPWLHALGITNAKGEVLAASQDKWRQINKYLEIIESLLRTQALPANPEIADMGSGKGYLTFALYQYLSTNAQLQPHITGIELRPNLVEFCNRVAREHKMTGLEFRAMDIKDYHPERLDMLIALHACDTATDLALAAGIHRHAGIIVAAPCCHKQVRKDMHTHNELAPVLAHGILEERQAEILTDGIRALLLESEGYQTKVFEFVSTDHTAKNIMITAVGAQASSGSRREAALEKVAALKKGFGLKEHFLEKLI